LEILAIARNRAENEGAASIASNLTTLKVNNYSSNKVILKKNLKELHIYQNGIK